MSEAEGSSRGQTGGGDDPKGGEGSSEERADSAAVSGTGEPEREQARGGSGEPPVPDSETAASGAEQAGEEVTDERDGEGGMAEGESSAGVEATGAVEVPQGHGVDDGFRAEVEEIMSRYPQVRSASIPVLFAIQRRWGWCTPEGMAEGASIMGVTPAYLESVASFYDLFHTEPAGRHRVLVCTNISCWMRGGDELLDAFCEATGADRHAAGHGGVVSPDGEIFLQGFECLGACDLAPMASIDERYYGPLAESDAAGAVAAIRGGTEVLADKQMATRPAAGGPEAEADPRVANAG